MSKVDVLPQVAAFLQRRHGSFIDGQWVVEEGTSSAVLNPATGEVIAQVADASPELVERFSALVEEHGEELAQLETLCQGKSINMARMLDVGATVEFMRYMAGWATKIEGQTFDVSIPIPEGTRYTASTRREPVGVVAGIVPWNFPLMITTWKLIPALACGCTAVI